MILIISLNEKPLQDLEFVKPIEKILEKSKIKFKTKNYKHLTKKDIEATGKIILTGTSLKNKTYLENINKFDWLKDYNKPVLGICAGMQVLVKTFRGELKHNQEIGLTEINFKKTFLGINGKRQVYELHNLSVTKAPGFEVYSRNSKSIQAIKHKSKPFYGILFHPEVRNEDFILNFCEA